MENKLFLEELKFGMGDGHLHYYLYNFKCPELPPDKVGVALFGRCGCYICLFLQVGVVLQ